MGVWGPRRVEGGLGGWDTVQVGGGGELRA